MIDILKEKYKAHSISKVTTSIKKFNNKGFLAKKAKLASIENYLADGYLRDCKLFYSDEKSIKDFYIYDSSKRKLEKTHLFRDGNIEYKHVWLYDLNDRLIEEGKYHYNYADSMGIARLGRNWKGEYDNNGNLISSIQYSHGNEIEEGFKYKYNDKGLLIEKTTDGYVWSYIYNDNKQLKELIRVQSFFKNKVDYSWIFEYDNCNNLVQKTRYLNEEIDHIMKWQYESGNKVKESESVNEDGRFVEYITKYEYSENNLLLREIGSWLTSHYRYDKNGLLIEEYNIDANENVTSRKMYTRDENGLIISLQENKHADIPKQILLYEYE